MRHALVSERWLGGTLTNYRTIRDRLNRLHELETMWLPGGEDPSQGRSARLHEEHAQSPSGKFESNLAPPTAAIRGYSKKMVATLNRESPRSSATCPASATCIARPRRWSSSIPSASTSPSRRPPAWACPPSPSSTPTAIPILVDLPIPGNDDSIRSIGLILGKLRTPSSKGKAAPPRRHALGTRAAQSASRWRRPRRARPATASTPPAHLAAGFHRGGRLRAAKRRGVVNLTPRSRLRSTVRWARSGAFCLPRRSVLLIAEEWCRHGRFPPTDVKKLRDRTGMSFDAVPRRPRPKADGDLG